MSYLKDREIWLSNVPTGNPPAGYFWKFIQNGKVVVRDSSGNNQMMVATSGSQAITGSLTVTGGITGTVSSASYVEYSNVANKPALVSGSAQIAEFGYATTGSNGFNGSQSITGSLTVTGQVVAQTLNVQQVTSSIVYSSGSNVFGNSLSNTQQFTGSVSVTGSLTVAGAGTFNGNVTLSGTNSQLLQTISNSIAGDNAAVFYNSNANSYGLYIGAGSGTNHALYITDSTRTKDLFKVQGNGNVGIGTSTPDVTGFGWRTLTIRGGTSSGEAGVLELQSPSTTGAANLGIIAFLDGSTRGGQIYVQRDSSTTTSNMLFATNGGSGIVERMRITSAGVVQIGNDVNPYLEIANGGSTDVLSGIRWMVGSGRVNYGGVEMAAPSADNGYMIFKTRNSGTTAERMRITSGGSINFSGIDATTQYYFGYNRPTATNLLVNGTNNNKIRIQNVESDVVVLNSNGNSYFNGGNVGIGTASPSAELEISKAQSTGAVLKLTNPNTENTSQDLGTLGFVSGDQSTSQQGLIRASVKGIAGELAYGTGGQLVFSTMQTYAGGSNDLIERMRITSEGQVQINGNTGIGSASKLQVVGPEAGPTFKNETSAQQSLFLWNSATSGNNLFLEFGTEAAGSLAVRGSIDYNRAGGLVRYNTTSDANLKNLIGDSDKQKSVDLLNSTKIREYSWKNDESNKSQIGVIAQELHETYKGAVSVGSDDELLGTEDYKPWSVDKTAFTFHLIAGFQEHERIIKEQQTLIESLKSRIEILEQ
jgi:hypothetical protein